MGEEEDGTAAEVEGTMEDEETRVDGVWRKKRDKTMRSMPYR